MANHSANSTALGYLYQTDWALLELLSSRRSKSDAAISLELLDDVAWEDGAQPQELLQVKHHQNRAGSLGDMSVDLWKTLMVWMDDSRWLDASGPTLALVSTSSAPAGGIASLLGTAGRDIDNAIVKLDAAAANSTTMATDSSRAKWLSLTPAQKLGLIARVRIADNGPLLQAVDDAVARELFHVIPTEHADMFLGLVWRWWRRVSIDMLRRTRRSVSVIEANQQISSIRDMFTSENLPTLVQLADVDEDDLIGVHDDYQFVEQLRWVKVTTVNLRKSIVDYYRAVTQTTQWIDNSLIGLLELEQFEDNLRDEWSRCFDDMIDDLPDDADESARQEAGKSLFRKLRDSTAVSVRAKYNDPFFARGKRHELVNGGGIGWHPDFVQRLEMLTIGNEHA